MGLISDLSIGFPKLSTIGQVEVVEDLENYPEISAFISNKEIPVEGKFIKIIGRQGRQMTDVPEFWFCANIFNFLNVLVNRQIMKESCEIIPTPQLNSPSTDGQI